MSLVARYLEEHGIPALIIGSALDVVSHASAPRYLHVDFPLGNPCGRPADKEMQRAIITLALEQFNTMTPEHWLTRAPFQWSDDQSWRDNYSRVDDSNREALRKRGEERRARQDSAKRAGLERAEMISET